VGQNLEGNVITRPKTVIARRRIMIRVRAPPSARKRN
jgi:hypothetical protein